jgi:hypothetical protein
MISISDVLPFFAKVYLVPDRTKVGDGKLNYFSSQCPSPEGYFGGMYRLRLYFEEESG